MDSRGGSGVYRSMSGTGGGGHVGEMVVSTVKTIIHQTLKAAFLIKVLIPKEIVVSHLIDNDPYYQSGLSIHDLGENCERKRKKKKKRVKRFHGFQYFESIHKMTKQAIMLIKILRPARKYLPSDKSLKVS
jgi:predicted RNA-binding protein with RPS1 domain